MAYLGKTPSQAVRSRYYFTATGGETSLSGTDDNSNTLTFTDGNYVDVALNGVTLVAGTDYNTTTANTIGGLTALVASDVVEVIVYDTFSVFGGNMAANLNFKDNVKANFGTGNDLQIYHDGSNSFVSENGIGSLFLQGDVVAIRNSGGTEDFAQFTENGAATLYYDNASKLATTATGVDVTGTVTADSVGVGAAPNATFGSLLYTQGTPAVNKPIVSAYSQGNSNNAGFALFNDSGNRGIWTTGSTMRFTRTYEGNSTADVTIDASGNVGIGTAAPPEKLSIEAPLSTLAGLGLTYSGATKAVFSVLPSTGEVRIGGTAANYFPTFYSSGSERMRIDSSGSVFVAKTTTNFATAGIEIRPVGAIDVTRSSGSPLHLNRTSTDGDISTFYKDGTQVGSIGVDNTDNLTISGNSSHCGLNFSSNDINPYKNGAYTDGTTSLGSSSTRFNDLYLSGGVLLGGVGSANYLDDYEEGTWTPQLWKGATQVTSPSSSGGKYIKIGDMLYINWYVYKSSGTNTDNGNWLIKGIPFTLSASNPYTSVPVTYFTLNNVNQFNASPARMQVNGTNYLEMYGAQANTNWTSGIVELGGSGVIRLT